MIDLVFHVIGYLAKALGRSRERPERLFKDFVEPIQEDLLRIQEDYTRSFSDLADLIADESVPTQDIEAHVRKQRKKFNPVRMTTGELAISLTELFNHRFEKKKPPEESASWLLHEDTAPRWWASAGRPGGAGRSRLPPSTPDRHGSPRPILDHPGTARKGHYRRFRRSEMRGWLHDFLVQGIASAVDTRQVRIYREYSVRVGDRTLFADLLLRSDELTVLVEVERSPDRVASDIEKAVALTVDVLLIVTPDRQTAAAVKRAVRRLGPEIVNSSPRIDVTPYGTAIQTLTDLMTISDSLVRPPVIESTNHGGRR